MAPRTNNVAKGVIAQKLSIACAMVVAGCVLGSDVAANLLASSQPHAAISTPHDGADSWCTAENLEALSRLHGVLDLARDSLMSDQVPHDLLLEHPFGTIAEVLDRALKELRPLKGTGQLNEEEEALIVAIAEARSKADRNARLIQQLLGQHKSYRSCIDRDGLVSLARRGREVAAEFNA